MDIKKTTCPYCGEEVEVGAQKCRYCGEWLINHTDNHVPQLDVPQQSGERRQTKRKSEMPTDQAKKSEKKPKWNIIIPVLCLVVGLGLLYWDSERFKRLEYTPSYDSTESVDSDEDDYSSDDYDTTSVEQEDTTTYYY